MNAWNRIPVRWLTDAYLTVWGKEPVASCSTGCLCTPTHVRLNDLNHKSSLIVTWISICFTKMSLWLGNILWAEWNWMHEVNHVIAFFLSTNHLCTFGSEFCVMESLCKTSQVSQKYAYALNHKSCRGIAARKAETVRRGKNHNSLNLPPTRPLNAGQLGLDFPMHYGKLRLFSKSGQAINV